jgi:hypothetical protein
VDLDTLALDLANLEAVFATAGASLRRIRVELDQKLAARRKQSG